MCVAHPDPRIQEASPRFPHLQWRGISSLPPSFPDRFLTFHKYVEPSKKFVSGAVLSMCKEQSSLYLAIANTFRDNRLAEFAQLCVEHKDKLKKVS